MKTYSKLLLLILSTLAAGYGTVKAANDSAWISLFDGTNLDHWNTTGDANWHIVDDTVQADAGSGMLVSKQSYRDFEIRLEFWVDTNSNSGVFIRCQNPTEISPTSCYEVNIFDSRPDQSGRSGAIVDVAPPLVVISTEGRWNTYEIKAEGTHLVVKLNGTVTVDAHDGKLAEGPFTLQYGAGGVKFRNVQIRPL
ncbi:MAG: hypothetical protein HW386_1650 [Gammaproteobacteria bacterium]|nr:hypothetical protein [Gammaproteobacteria bacterium]